MGFRLALAARRHTALRPPPEVPQVARLAAALSAADGSEARPPEDLDVLANRFVATIGQGGEPRLRDWNRIAWCIWTTHPAIAEDVRSLDAVLERVARSGRRRPYRQLAAVYFMEFAPDRPQLDRIAEVLASLAGAADDVWARLHARYGVFGGRQAPIGLARSVLPTDQNIPGLLANFGLGEAAATGRFAFAAYISGLLVLRQAQPSEVGEKIAAVQRWCFGPDGRLIFGNSRQEVARTLVMPYRDSALPDGERDALLGFVLRHFGDPRTRPAEWIGADDAAEVVKKWLTGQTLRQFFDVVDRIAPSHAWKYRRAFWDAYHSIGLIRNAWVIFGDDGAAEVKRRFGPHAAFGRFKGGGRKGVLQGHAVLLLDFGQCVVADWSHNGYCNIWRSADSSRPRRLNADSYTTDEIRHEVPSDRTEISLSKHDIFAHMGSESYVWQQRVARRIRELTGILVPESAYRVR